MTTADVDRERFAARLVLEAAEVRATQERRREIAVAAALGEERAMHQARVLDSDEEGHRRRAPIQGGGGLLR
jgi:hypothetical protein